MLELFTCIQQVYEALKPPHRIGQVVSNGIENVDGQTFESLNAFPTAEARKSIPSLAYQVHQDKLRFLLV